jgi:serine/threonine-protein kinase
MVNGGRITIGDRFEIANPVTDRLGNGGMGAVYLGLDKLTGQKVAIKALRRNSPLSPEEMIKRFIREGEALRLLEHPNIIEVIDTIHEPGPANDAAGTYYLIMEYASGGTLDDLLARQGRLSCQRALEIGLDLSDALAHAHRIGIIHRDVKPGNVLLSAGGAPLLTDFGLALRIDRSNMVQPATLAGTIGYLSPEACHGKPLDHLSDIWSFGVMLFELLTGQQPFARESMATTLAAIISEPVPDMREYCPEAPDRLVQLLAFILQKDRRLRLSSMRLVGAELEAILAASHAAPNGSHGGAWGVGFWSRPLEQIDNSLSFDGSG